MTVDVARKLDIPKMFLVVNKVLSSFDFAEVKRTMEETYGCQVAGVLPLSEDVVRLASTGIFCLRYPDHPFTQSLIAIANRIRKQSL